MHLLKRGTGNDGTALPAKGIVKPFSDVNAPERMRRRERLREMLLDVPNHRGPVCIRQQDMEDAIRKRNARIFDRCLEVDEHLKTARK
jgi:hypothetical protein